MKSFIFAMCMATFSTFAFGQTDECPCDSSSKQLEIIHDPTTSCPSFGNQARTLLTEHLEKNKNFGVDCVGGRFHAIDSKQYPITNFEPEKPVTKPKKPCPCMM